MTPGLRWSRPGSRRWKPGGASWCGTAPRRSANSPQPVWQVCASRRCSTASMPASTAMRWLSAVVDDKRRRPCLTRESALPRAKRLARRRRRCRRRRPWERRVQPRGSAGTVCAVPISPPSRPSHSSCIRGGWWTRHPSRPKRVNASCTPRARHWPGGAQCLDGPSRSRPWTTSPGRSPASPPAWTVGGRSCDKLCRPTWP
jgi:hypothetical protein